MRNIRHTFFSLALACAAFAQSAPAQEKAAATQASPAPPQQSSQQKAAAPAAPQKLVKQGVEVEFTVEPVAAGAGAARTDGGAGRASCNFRVTRHDDGHAALRHQAAAWASRRGAATRRPTPRSAARRCSRTCRAACARAPTWTSTPTTCSALNQEPNISVIDPLLGFGGSKLVTLVMLKSPGEDWAITADRSNALRQHAAGQSGRGR